MALEDIYNPKLRPIYRDATDVYMSSIPAEDTYDIPADLARNPSKVAKYVEQALQQNQDAMQDIEARRMGIAFRASVLMELVEGFDELVAAIPPDIRKQVDEWASRIRKRDPSGGES